MDGIKKIKIEDKKVFYTKKKSGLAGYINLDVSRYIGNCKNLLKNLSEYVKIKDDELVVNMAVIGKLEVLKKKCAKDERKAVSNLLTSLKNVTGINKPTGMVGKDFSNSYQL